MSAHNNMVYLGDKHWYTVKDVDPVNGVGIFLVGHVCKGRFHTVDPANIQCWACKAEPSEAQKFLIRSEVLSMPPNTQVGLFSNTQVGLFSFRTYNRDETGKAAVRNAERVPDV